MLFYRITLMLKEILNDTLKRNGKWSSTLFTMFSAWKSSLIMAWIDFGMNGFIIRWEVWAVLVSVGAGIKITDAISKKIKPPLE